MQYQRIYLRDDMDIYFAKIVQDLSFCNPSAIKFARVSAVKIKFRIVKNFYQFFFRIVSLC